MSIGQTNKKLFAIFGLLTILTVQSTLFKYYENYNVKNNEGQVLQASDQVSVSASVYGCTLTVKAKPEKRVLLPNWGTQLTVEIFNNETFVGSVIIPTDNDGTGTADLCAEGITEVGGTYNIKIKGLSHLFKKYPNTQALSTAETNIDFTNNETIYLYAGETSNIYDNYINSLDLSTQITNLYTNNEKNDLNQDNEVNSLDISNTIWNFYMVGD